MRKQTILKFPIKLVSFQRMSYKRLWRQKKSSKTKKILLQTKNPNLIKYQHKNQFPSILILVVKKRFFPLWSTTKRPRTIIIKNH